MARDVNFLFWNVARNAAILPFLDAIVKERGVDVLILAENVATPANILEMLNAESADYFYSAGQGMCRKIHVFTRFDPAFLSPIGIEDHRIAARKLALPGCEEVMLVMLHLLDKGSATSGNQQLQEAAKYSAAIRVYEAAIDHTKTLVVGDFNMDPHDTGMKEYSGFHAAMTQNTAKARMRVVQGRSYTYFYNPMWSYLGDLSKGVPGSYHYSKSSQKWHMFDQVLLRPDLLPNFDFDTLEVLERYGALSLLKSDGTINKKISDHLPLFFTLHV